MPFAATAQIDLDALRANLALIRSRAPTARIMAAVKANAYGHGMVEVAEALAKVDALAVARVDEAEVLRAAGIQTAVTVLEGIFDAHQLRAAASLHCDLVVHCDAQIDLLGAHQGAPLVVWLKVNTGMNRIGFKPEAAIQAWHRLSHIASVSEIRFMTHFACADEVDGYIHSEQQLSALSPVLALSRDDVSVANSAALFSTHDVYQRFNDAAATDRTVWVRPGIALYGVSPSSATTAESLGLAPVMNFESRIIAVQTLQPGDRVGYGGRFVATAPMRIGVVAAGYGDGYPRLIPDGTPVIADGITTKIVGRVSMDMLTIDLTPCPEVGFGATVRLWGEGVPVETVASAIGTIGYELLTRVSARAQRQFRC